MLIVSDILGKEVVDLLSKKKKVAVIGSVGAGKTFLVENSLKLLQNKEIMHIYDDRYDVDVSNILDNEFVDMFYDAIVIDSSDVKNLSRIREAVCGVLVTSFDESNINKNVFDVIVKLEHDSNYKYEIKRAG